MVPTGRAVARSDGCPGASASRALSPPVALLVNSNAFAAHSCRGWRFPGAHAANTFGGYTKVAHSYGTFSMRKSGR